MALFYVTILLFVLTRPDSSLTKILRMKWLCWLGTLAYGIYLFHQGIQYMFFGLIWGHGSENNGRGDFGGDAGGDGVDAFARSAFLALLRAAFNSHWAPVKF